MHTGFKLRRALATSDKNPSNGWRKAEEGQALVIIAFAMTAIVAMLGLVIDFQIATSESDRVQDAANNAALAGAPYAHRSSTDADGMALRQAEASGFKVACYYDSGPSASADYNNRCRRADWQAVQSAQPDQLFYFESQTVTKGDLTTYTVKLGKLQSRLFLSVIGFPNYSILKTATAKYVATQVVPPVVPPAPSQPPAFAKPTPDPNAARRELDAQLARLQKNMSASGSGGNSVSVCTNLGQNGCQ